MTTTLFERNFKEATARLLAFDGRPMDVGEVSKIFFNGATKIPNRLMTYAPKKGKKNAIVLIGLSCTGKSTFAKEFIKTHTDFEYLSLDDCALREMEKTNMIVCFGDDITKNTLGFREFGEKIATGKNLIIDGGWVHINSRAALLKTLKQFGYNTCACVFCQYSQEEYMRNIEARVTAQIAFELLEKDEIYSDKDWLTIYQEEKKVTREKAVAVIRTNEKYNARLYEEFNVLLNEKQDSAYMVQLESGLMVVGFDSMLIK